LAGYLLVGLALRIALYLHFPALLTNDSPDYVRGGIEIFWTGNFASFSLRDVRMPGYPMFLAALYGLTGSRSDLLVLAQSMLGMLCILLGWRIGRRLGSQPVADALGMFFALCPVYLLLEHALMTEALALFVMVAFTLLVIAALPRAPSPLFGFSAAVLLGFGGLVRINLLPFCGVLLALLAARWTYVTLHGSFDRRRALRLGGVLLAMICGVGIMLGPWVWRNATLYGLPALSLHTSRSLLVWKTMSGSMDSTLPLFRQYAFGYNTFDYAWLAELDRRYPTNAAEAIAAAIVGEQVYAHPNRHRDAMGAALLNYAGIYSSRTPPRDDRAMLAFWFGELVPTPVDVETSVPRTHEWLDFRPLTQPSLWTALWSRAGLLYLLVLRPLLLLAFLAAVVLFAVRLRRGAYRLGYEPNLAVLGLSVAYAATWLFHGVTLTGSDRFAAIADWVALLVVVYVACHQQHPAGRQFQPHRVAGPRQDAGAVRRQVKLEQRRAGEIRRQDDPVVRPAEGAVDDMAHQDVGWPRDLA
jgi:hypothetical protein